MPGLILRWRAEVGLGTRLRGSMAGSGGGRATIFKRFIRSLSAQEQNVSSTLELKKTLQSHRISFKQGHAALSFPCPFCKAEARQSVFLNSVTGGFVCPPCSVSMNWQEFCAKLSQSKAKQGSGQGVVIAKSHDSGVESCDQLLRGCDPWKEAGQGAREGVVKAFGLERIKDVTFAKYQVNLGSVELPSPHGGKVPTRCVVFPWMSGTGRGVVRVKLQPIPSDHAPSDHAPSDHTPLVPRDGAYSLFGWHLVKEDHRKVVITGSEFDAMAVHQETGLPAVALPLGLSLLPLELLPLLEQFSHIVLWLGSGLQARQIAHHFASKLSLQRCHLVRSVEGEGPVDSALRALNEGGDLGAAVKAAQPFEHKKILAFSKLREDVLNELTNVDQVAGVKWRRFPALSAVLKGHRPGELTLFTGPTGSGKTTLMSELSLDLCAQGVPTLWGSFEIKNVRLAKIMLRQFANLNLERNLGQFSYWADRMELLPLYFMGFYGSVDVSNVLEAMAHAAYVHDVRHVIIDNLQFMTGNVVNGMDRFAVQDRAISEFRRFASEKGVHVTVVVHPRKEEDYTTLQTSSLFGTAKAGQEGDNVLILQKPSNGGKYLEVTKNRFDGDLGRVALNFNRESLTFSSNSASSSGVKVTPTAVKVTPTHQRSPYSGVKVTPTAAKIAPTHQRSPYSDVKVTPTAAKITPTHQRSPYSGVKVMPTHQRSSSSGVKVTPTAAEAALSYRNTQTQANLTTTLSSRGHSPSALRVRPIGVSPVAAAGRGRSVGGKKIEGRGIWPTTGSSPQKGTAPQKEGVELDQEIDAVLASIEDLDRMG